MSTNFKKLALEGKHDEIIRNFENLSASSPNDLDVDTRFFAMYAYCMVNLYHKASSVGKYLLPLMPMSIDFLSLYAVSLRKTGDISESQKVFCMALDIDPQNLTILNNYSNLLIDLGDLSQASEVLNRVLNINPLYQDAQINLNRLNHLLATKQKDIVAKTSVSNNYTLTTIGLIDPLVDSLSTELASFSNDLNSNGKELLDTLLSNSDYKKAYANSSASELLDLGRKFLPESPKEVITHCNRIINLHGPLYDVYVLAGDAYILLKLFADAETSFWSAHYLKRDCKVVIANLVSLLTMRNDMALARSLFFNHLSDDVININAYQAIKINLECSGDFVAFQYNPSQATEGIVEAKYE